MHIQAYIPAVNKYTRTQEVREIPWWVTELDVSGYYTVNQSIHGEPDGSVR